MKKLIYKFMIILILINPIHLFAGFVTNRQTCTDLINKNEYFVIDATSYKGWIRMFNKGSEYYNNYHIYDYNIENYKSCIRYFIKEDKDSSSFSF